MHEMGTEPIEVRVVVEPVSAPADPTVLAARLADAPGFMSLVGSGASDDSRFSILGAWPYAERRVDAGAAAHGTDPFAALRPDLRRIVIREAPPDLPCTAGALVMLGYDLRTSTERLPDRHGADRGCPELLARFFDSLVVCDRRSGSVVVTRLEAPADAEITRESAAHAAALRDAIERHTPIREPSRRAPVAATASMSRCRYLDSVERIILYIRAGDVYQVNLSQRFEGPVRTDASSLFTRLMTVNPAPFGGLVRLAPDSWLLSASPERFLRVEGARVVTRPIKGTAPRGPDDASDRAQAEELLASEKNRAELAMIVDLLRNDLSRNCQPGSVRVRERLVLESHPTVHHLVATIEGTLTPGRDVLDLLRDAWPGGSISGVPKIRAQEIIDELETCRRGPYTGSLGYLGFDGRADLNILIRTLRLEDGRAWLHGGGGIVVDSDPDLEWRETIHKVRGLFEALDWEVPKT